jgi:Fe2+ or Zn2+ uptake regulation protein
MLLTPKKKEILKLLGKDSKHPTPAEIYKQVLLLREDIEDLRVELKKKNKTVSGSMI